MFSVFCFAAFDLSAAMTRHGVLICRMITGGRLRSLMRRSLSVLDSSSLKCAIITYVTRLTDYSVCLDYVVGLLTGPGKLFIGILESPGFFVSKRMGTLGRR